MLEGLETMYIIGTKFQSAAIDNKERCTLVHNKYVCGNKGFVLRDIVSWGCEFQLTHNMTATKCSFIPIPNDYMVLPLETTSAVFCKNCSLTEICHNSPTSFL